MPASVPRLDEVHVSLPVLLFRRRAVDCRRLLSFGILPALRSLHIDPQAALQANSSRTANTREGRRTRNLLVAAQVACTIVLLIVTSLVLRSFSHLLRQDRGFDASHVTLAQVDLFTPQYDDAGTQREGDQACLCRSCAHRSAATARRAVRTITSVAPLTGETWVDNITRPDHPVPAGQEPAINVRWINPDYLPTMQIPLVAGRNITAADRANPYVALISERTAREAFPGENPIGRKIDSIVPDDNIRSP